MRTYSRIESGFWHSVKVKRLTERGRLLLLYVLTCSHANSIGCFTLPAGYVAVDMNWDEAVTAQHLTELESVGIIDRDPATDLIRVVGWWDHNSIENPNVAKAVVKAAVILPKSSPVYTRFLQDIAAYQETRGAGIQSELRKLFEKGHANGSGNGSETVSEGIREPFRNPIPNPIPNPLPNRKGAPSDDGPPPAAALIETAKDRLFHLGVPYLTKRAGKTDDQARRIIGGWLKSNLDDVVLAAIAKAQAAEAVEPISYISAVLKPKKATNDGRPAGYTAGSL